MTRTKGEDRRRRGRGGMLRRGLGWLAFLPIASRAPTYVRLLWALVRDERTPPGRKALLAAALGYLVVGRDLIPDEVPLIGRLDDVVVVVLAVDVFLEGIPRDLLHEKLDELGIEREAFDRDVAQVRRLMPGPLRRSLRQLPGFVNVGARAAQASGLGPRLRAWITKEDSIA
ncbi:MAG TPA: DUF1232 domain-containing protein [Candidatus Limnocylindrales bacterium]